MLFDLFIEQRLRDRRIVDFAVSVPAIADEIDNDVGTELVAILSRKARHADDSINIFAIDMEDGNRLASRDAGRESRRVLLDVTRGESNEVVNDHVNRAADGVSRQVGIIHRLGENALPGKRGIRSEERRVGKEWKCR